MSFLCVFEKILLKKSNFTGVFFCFTLTEQIDGRGDDEQLKIKH